MNARELLEELLNYVEFDINDELTKKVQAYLAQPETKSEPVSIVGVWIDGNLPCFNTAWLSFPSNWPPGEYKLYAEPPKREPLSDGEALEIARHYAKLKPKSYYGEPFYPHEWVIDAIKHASTISEPSKREPVLLSGEQIVNVFRDAHDYSELKRRYDFNEDKFFIGIQCAVLKANGIEVTL
jgi:hypothetical protein